MTIGMHVGCHYGEQERYSCRGGRGPTSPDVHCMKGIVALGASKRVFVNTMVWSQHHASEALQRGTWYNKCYLC